MWTTFAEIKELIYREECTMKILVIEDGSILREDVSALLQEINYIIHLLWRYCA